MTYRVYKMQDAYDRATLQPGYYWINTWHGLDNIIVTVYRGKKGRMVTDGCEYSDRVLSELIEGQPNIRFCGPITAPENFN